MGGRFSRDRRTRHAQRRAVERVLADIEGSATVRPAGDGWVWIYDEVRAGAAPGTRRFHVGPDGETDPPDFFPFQADRSALA
jgi:hypothetical protein